MRFTKIDELMDYLAKRIHPDCYKFRDDITEILVAKDEYIDSQSELEEAMAEYAMEFPKVATQITKRLFPDMFDALLEYRNPKTLGQYRELQSLVNEEFWEWYETSWLEGREG